jgi:queuine tRNA-ribosyltransferase
LHFSIQHKDKESSARTGILNTGHGPIHTPVFMPVGTAGTVKSVHQRELVNDIKATIILGNTYHLYLRPGMETMSLAGGLHRFMNWNQAILTDSGGYQVFSLAANRKLNEEGVIFRSHIDGSKHVFTPEGIVDVQRIIGADIIMALDECTPFPCEPREAKKSMELTHRWLDRGCRQFLSSEPKYGFEQLFFPIVQGSIYTELRKISAEKIASAECAGNAIGGLSVGEPEEQMYEMIEVVNRILPEDKPRYLMGVGTPANILEAISLGIDMFDCVMPTRNARNGMLFTSNGIINIRNLKWKNDFSPVDENGNTFVDLQYSKAYLRHLVISGEILGAQIATIHNLGFYLCLVREAGNKIREGSFVDWKTGMIKKLKFRL